jgi:hypothetical protein
VKTNRKHTTLWLACLFTLSAVGARADVPIVEIAIKDHLFYPSKITIARGQKVKLIVSNNDPTPEEFESHELNREKVIMGERRAIIFIGPLPPGEYSFFGGFHPKTALGTVIVE